MKHILLVTTAALALLGFQARPGRAQIPTIDAASIAQLLSQLQQMKQDYQVYMGIFGSLLRVVDPNSMATGIVGSQPLPGVPQISQMMVGNGNFGSLAGLASQFLQANTVYTPQSTGANDFNAAFMQRNGNTLAGVQAMVQQSITSIQSHIAGLTDVQQQLSTVKTDADVAAIQGRLQAEQANLTAQGVQAQSLQTMMAAQQQAYTLQTQQMARQSADSVVAYYGGSAPLTTPTTTAANLPTFSSTGP
jgi:hypothetical protein